MEPFMTSMQTPHPPKESYDDSHADWKSKVETNAKIVEEILCAKRQPQNRDIAQELDIDKDLYSLGRTANQEFRNYPSQPLRKSIVRQRRPDELNELEEEYMKKRDSKTKEAWSALCGGSLTDANFETPGSAPRIALCFSGGSVLSMVGTCAYLNWFKHNGILDAVSVVSGQSGSSWCLGTWLASDRGNILVGACTEKEGDGSTAFPYADPWSTVGDPATTEKECLERCANQLDNVFCNDMSDSAVLIQMLRMRKQDWATQLVFKLLQEKPLGSLDLNGLLLGVVLTAQLKWWNKMQSRWSDSRKKLDDSDGGFPVPVCVAAAKPSGSTTWHLAEFTPFEVYIPTLDTGTKFYNRNPGEPGGVDTNKKNSTDEWDFLHYLFAIWGASTLKPIQCALREAIDSLTLGKETPWWSATSKRFFNDDEDGEKTEVLCWDKAYKEVHPKADLPLGDVDLVTMTDAGAISQWPLSPLMEKKREIDLILMCDTVLDGSARDNLKKTASMIVLSTPELDDEVQRDKKRLKGSSEWEITREQIVKHMEKITHMLDERKGEIIMAIANAGRHCHGGAKK